MILKKGAKGAAVQDLQLKLARLGYLPKDDDGIFGNQVQKAVRDFQAAHKLLADGQVGPLTMGVIDQKISQLPKRPPAPAPVSNSETPWMDWMYRNLGEKEIPGTRANQFIVDCFKYTSLKGQRAALSDETAWCAALANATLVKNGYKGTNSAAAASFDHSGNPCDYKYGALVPIRHADGSRHITFFVKWFNKKSKIAICLGGNQSNRLKESKFNLSGNAHGKDQCASPRWPVKLAK